MIELLERAIKAKAERRMLGCSSAVSTVRKHQSYALRLHDVSLEMLRGSRDESEPIIRLADMMGRLHSWSHGAREGGGAKASPAGDRKRLYCAPINQNPSYGRGF